jgi:NADPH:quinone reductase-like Zn-dependent oxidoreductase
MRGVYLSYTPASSEGGKRRLVPRIEEHVMQPALEANDVTVQIRACGICRIDVKTFSQVVLNVDQIPVGNEISGVVTKVGEAVKMFSIGDEVTGILPLYSECPGCAEYCVIAEHFLVSKPVSLSHVDCAAGLGSGLRAYTALHTQATIVPGNVVLVTGAASADGVVMIQWCESLGAKVIAAVNHPREAEILQKLQPSLLRVIDLSASQNIVDACLQETGGLGVHCVIDNGASSSHFLSDFIIDSTSLKQQLEQEPLRYTYEDDPSPSLSPTAHQIISLLASRGHWVTSQPELQLDPPEAQILYLKGASLHFMFPPVWTLSGAQLGSYLGVLQQVLKNMEDGAIKPHIYKAITLDQVCDELMKLGTHGTGKIVMKATTQ